MRYPLLALVLGTVCMFGNAPVTAAELADLFPNNIEGFEPPDEPRTRSLVSGAEQAMTSYSAGLRFLRLRLTDTGTRASDTLDALEAQVQAGELTKHDWQGYPLFTNKVEMRRDQYIDAFLPVGRMVVSFRLKDSDGGEVTIADVKSVLTSIEPKALLAYAEQLEAPRVLYTPFAKVEPQSPIDADTLADFLPPKAGGQARGKVQQQVHGYGKKASAAVFASYGDGALIAIIDQGGLPAGYFPLLGEGVRTGLFEESVVAGQPLFVRVAPGELPVDIEVPGALAVAGERFQVQVEIKGDELQPETARAVAGAVDLQGLAQLGESLVDRETFRQRFRACEPANFVAAPAYNAGYRYEIIGTGENGCRVRGRYTRNPNKALVGPSMTCVWDNNLPFDQVVENIESCEGPLRKMLDG